MKKIIKWLEKKLPVIKIIFLLSVIIIVVGQLSSIGKTISMAQIKDIFSQIPGWKLMVMALAGMAAVTPMLGYDIILNQMLGQKPKKSYLLETSWMINTINNIAGFGGLISVGLRSEVYGKGAKGKKVLQSLSKILLFLMSGLSIYSLLCFLIVAIGRVNPFVDQYWIWLIGGGLYFPAVFFVTKRKKESLLGGLERKKRWGLVLTSFLEWTGVAGCFLIVGRLMDITFSPMQVLALFIAASVIGIVSMIPGALGSFDVMMIIGLSALDIPRGTVVTWILLYRLAYYIIPFCIGIVFFFKNMGKSLDQRFDGVLKDLVLEISHKALVFAMYFSAIMMVLLATIPEAFSEFKWLSTLNPWRFHIITQFPSLLLGFLLLVMGRGIAARVKRAYLPTLMLLVLAIIYTFFGNFSLVPMIFLCVLLLMTIISKRELYREQFVYSFESMTKDGFTFLSLVILYITIGVYNLPVFHHRRRFISFFLFPSENAWLSGLAAILIVACFIWLFLKYLEGEKRTIGEKIEDSKVEAVLKKYGGNPDSQLVFLDDKRVYFYHDGFEETVFFQMNTFNNKVIVMGDPAGKEADFPKAIQQLIHEADEWGYLPVFYEVSEKIVMLLHEFGYDFIKMGEDAKVDLAAFTISGKKMKGQRAIMNRLRKENYTFEVREPPFSSEFIQDIRKISDAWLGSRREKGFSLGFFSESYLQRAPIAVVRNAKGEIVAFANLMHTYTDDIGTIDLMRQDPVKAPSGTMDFLFIHLFEYMKAQGIRTFDLGMAPLSNVGKSRKSFIQERIASLVYQFGTRFYSFQGLRDYKEKYTENWTPRYTAYSRDSWVIYVMGALLIIDNAPVEEESTSGRPQKFLKAEN